MPLKSQDLDRVYGARTPEESRAAYDGWAASYDADNIAKGFRLPLIVAGFAARHLPGGDAPVLDCGCGTGLLGEALGVLGFRRIAGLDLSPGMLEAARATGAYERLYEHRLGAPIPEPDGAFAGTLCTGSFGPGHAPPESLREMVRVTRPGGHVIFNVVEASWRGQGFPEVIAELAEAGRWRAAEEPEPFRAYLLAEPDLLVRVLVFEVL